MQTTQFWDGRLCPGSIPSARCLFRYVTNQPAKVNSAFHPSGVGKWVLASARKDKAGMVHSVSRWTRGVQVKLWDPLRTRAISERLRGVFTTRRYTPSLSLPLHTDEATFTTGGRWTFSSLPVLLGPYHDWVALFGCPRSGQYLCWWCCCLECGDLGFGCVW